MPKTIIRKNFSAEPIAIPQTSSTPTPFLLRFVEMPNGGMPPPGMQEGDSTYMGKTSSKSCESNDYNDDDAGGGA